MNNKRAKTELTVCKPRDMLAHAVAHAEVMRLSEWLIETTSNSGTQTVYTSHF